MNSVSIKVFPLILVFILGYGIASYQSLRDGLADEINDYQREILIAIRLFDEYSNNCTKKDFYPYVVHSISMYERLIKKSIGAPYFLDTHFINDHEESAFNFQKKVQFTQETSSTCS